jgi:hypothetical protein
MPATHSRFRRNPRRLAPLRLQLGWELHIAFTLVIDEPRIPEFKTQVTLLHTDSFLLNIK